MSDSAIQTCCDPIEQLAEEFVERMRNGERPAISEYVCMRPDLEADIRMLFPALIVMEQVGSDDGTSPVETAVTRDGSAPEQIGEYRILREVGRGGMGVVYEAEQESLGRHVALKVLPLGALRDPNTLKRFQREARAAARLHHPHIVPLYGVGEHEGIHYYAMQFIRGRGLDEILSHLMDIRGEGFRLSTETPLINAVEASHTVQSDSAVRSDSSTSDPSSLSQAGSSSPSHQEYYRRVAGIFAPIADALSYAHLQGILHRDVKPSNLMLDTDGHIWITDFGLAKTDAADDLTRTGDLVGTLRYMAPERFDGWSDPRSDVYGLGLTLYETLTLRPAYKDSNRARLILRITAEELPRPRRFDRKIPADLETIVLKSVAKEPGERYQSADQLAADLRRFMNQQPIQARRTSMVERVRMWCRRNPLVASLAAALVLLLTAGVISASRGALHFEQLADDRQQALDDKDRLLEQLSESRLIATKALYGSGRMNYEREEYDQAIENFSAVLEADPEHSDALWWRGGTYGRLGQSQNAADDISRFIELKPGLASGCAARGLRLGQLGEYHQAVQDYRIALELDPDNERYFHRLAWFQVMCPPEDRDLDEALQFASQAIDALPQARTYLTTLGIVHYRRREYERAIEVLQEADRMPSRYAFHYFYLAMCHQQRGELNRAIDYYRLADSKMVWGRNVLSFRLHEQNLYRAEAEALITTVLDDEPDHFDLLFLRAKLRYRLKNFEDMLRDTTRMIKLEPQEYLGYYHRATALMMLERDEEALRDLEQSLALRPGYAGTMRVLAWVLLTGPDHLRDFNRAFELAAEADRQMQGSPHYILTLGAAEYRLDRYEEARDTLERAASSPEDGVHTVRLLFLTMTYHQLDQPLKAQESYREALKRWQVSYCRLSDLEAIRAEAEAMIGVKQ